MVQGAVERLNQTLKRKLLLMEKHNTTRWSLYVQQVMDEYNNSYHSTIKQKPIDALRACWSTRSDVTIAEKIARYGHIKHLKYLIAKRGEQDRQQYMKKHQNMLGFQEGDVVLVRVPKKYRTKDQYLFGRKGIVHCIQKSDSGQSLYRYKIKWLETGGIVPSETVGTVSANFIDGRDLKKFCFGDDVNTEPSTVQEQVTCDAMSQAADDSSNVMAAVMSCSGSVGSPDVVARDPIHSTVEGVNHVSNVGIAVSRIQRKRMRRKGGQCTEVVRGSDHAQQFDEPEESNNDVSTFDVQLDRRRRRRTTMKRSREEIDSTADVCHQPGFLLVCDGCDTVYHPRCHHPMIDQIPSGE